MPSTGKVDEIWVDVGANLAPLKAGMVESEKVVSSSTKKMDESTARASKSMSQNLSNAARQYEKQAAAMGRAGKSITKNVTLPVLAVAIAAGKMNIDFERDMKKVQTQAGASASQLKVLTKAALELSTKGTQGPKAIADAMYHAQSLLAGQTGATQKAIALVRTAVDANAVSGASLDDITSALGAAVRTGIKGAQSMSVAMGTLNATVGAGNMQMSDLVGSLSTGILPAAKTAGLTLKDVGSALAMMADEGMPAQDAATRLRMTMALMAAPTHAASKALAEIGLGSLSLGHEMQKPQGLIKALSLLKSHLEAFSTDPVKQENVLVRAFGGGRSSAAVMLLLNNLKILDQKYNQVDKNQKKFAQDVAEAHQTAAYKIGNAWAKVQTSLTKFGGTIAPILAAGATALAAFVSGFQALPGPVKNAIGIIIGALAIGGPLLMGIAGAVKAIQTIGVAFGMSATEGSAAAAAMVGDNEAVAVAAGEAAAAESTIGAAAVASATKVGLLGKSFGFAAKALIGFVAIHEGVKALSGDPKMGWDFSDPAGGKGDTLKQSNLSVGDYIKQRYGTKAQRASVNPNSLVRFENQYVTSDHFGKQGYSNEEIRAKWGWSAEQLANIGKLKVSSAYRSPAHNKEVGGAKDSDHTRGDAVDLVGAGAKALYDKLTANTKQGKKLRQFYHVAYVEPWSQSKDHLHVSFNHPGVTGTDGETWQQIWASYQKNVKNLTKDSMTTPGTTKGRKTLGLTTHGLDKEQQTNAKLIFAYATKHGLTKEQALDMVSASNAESTLRTHALGPKVYGNGYKGQQATGLFQLLSPGYMKKAKLYAQQNHLVGGVNNPLAQLAAIFPDYANYYKNHPNLVKGAAASAVEKSGASASWYASRGYKGIGLGKGGFLASDLGSNAVSVHALKLASNLSIVKFSSSWKTQLGKVLSMADGPFKTRLLKIENTIGTGLSSNLITPVQLSALQTKLKSITTLMKAAMTKAAQAITSQKSVFTAAVTALMNQVDSAFQAKVAAGLKKLKATVTMPDGSTFLYNDQSTDPTLNQTPTQQLMAAHDKATSQIDAVQQLLQASQQFSWDKTIGVPANTDQYQSDQGAYTDAAYQQQVSGISDSQALDAWATQQGLKVQQNADGKHLDLIDANNNTVLQLVEGGLQDQADAEQKAADAALAQAQLNYQSEQDLLQQNMDAQVAILEQGVENGTITAAQFQTGVTDAMKGAGLSVSSFTGIMGDAFGTAFNESLVTAMTAVDNLAAAINRLNALTGAPQIAINDPALLTIAGGLDPAIATAVASGHKFAAGGVVKHQQGGVQGTIGEGRYDEAVIPLSPQNLGMLGGGGSGGGGDVVVNVVVPGNLVGAGGMQELAQILRTELKQLGGLAGTGIVG